MPMSKQDERNLNPTAPSLVAMALYCKRYMNQTGGSMDFFDKLSAYEKRTCAELAKQIKEAPLTE